MTGPRAYPHNILTVLIMLYIIEIIDGVARCQSLCFGVYTHPLSKGLQAEMVYLYMYVKHHVGMHAVWSLLIDWVNFISYRPWLHLVIRLCCVSLLIIACITVYSNQEVLHNFSILLHINTLFNYPLPPLSEQLLLEGMWFCNLPFVLRCKSENSIAKNRISLMTKKFNTTCTYLQWHMHNRTTTL